MSSARFIVGDTREVLKTLPDASVDLVMTSPPFLALRSYLPADHESKHLEIGSEATPGAFLDVLLDVVVELRRVLAPHGSLCVELGDTYGGGGSSDPRIEADGSTRSGANRIRLPDGRTIQGNGASNGQERKGDGWPLAKSLCMVPQSFAWALAYGRNPWTGRELEPWIVRNVIRWCRPNPPVGALGDKVRPATSEITVACTSPRRYFDLDAVREPYAANTLRNCSSDNDTGYKGRENGVGFRGERHLTHAGAPPLDYWVIPTHPYPGSHYATFPPELCVKPIKAMCPPFVCSHCGPVGLEYSDDATSLREMRGSDRQQIGVQGGSGDASVLLAGLFDQHDARGTTSEDCGEGPAAHESSVRLRGRALAGASHGVEVGSGVRAPAGDGRVPGPHVDGGRGSASQERGSGRQPARQSRADDAAGSSEGADAAVEAENLPALRRVRSGDEPCPSCGGALRRGLVLDPFAGSGTTLEVATGHGRDAIGIDLDRRNAELARQRVGLFLSVDEQESAA